MNHFLYKKLPNEEKNRMTSYQFVKFQRMVIK